MKIVSLILALQLPFASLPAFAFHTGEGYADSENVRYAKIQARILAEKGDELLEITLLAAVIKAVKAGEIKNILRQEAVDKAGRVVVTGGTSYGAAFLANKLIKKTKGGVLNRIATREVYDNWVAANEINVERLASARKALSLQEAILNDPVSMSNAEEAVKLAQENLARVLDSKPALIPAFSESVDTTTPQHAEEVAKQQAALESYNADHALAQDGIKSADGAMAAARETTNAANITAAQGLVDDASATLAHQMKSPSKYGPMFLRFGAHTVGLVGTVGVYAVATGLVIQFNFSADNVRSNLDFLQKRLDQKVDAFSASFGK
jgi:hypothetical protein